MHRESWLNPEALRAARVRAGLTQHELARLVGVAGGERVSRWELGTSRPRPEILRNRAHERFVTEVVQVHSGQLGETGYPVTEQLFAPREDGRAVPTGHKPTPEFAQRLLDVGFDLNWLGPGASTWDGAEDRWRR
jgi:transcriptional regulator with XRE-family HTH domain